MFDGVITCFVQYSEMSDTIAVSFGLRNSSNALKKGNVNSFVSIIQ